MDFSGKSDRFCPCDNHVHLSLAGHVEKSPPVPTTSSEPGRDLHSADVWCAPADEVTERI